MTIHQLKTGDPAAQPDAETVTNSLVRPDRSEKPPGGGDGSPWERLGRLEATVEALKRGQDIILIVMGLGFTIMITIMLWFGGYILARIDALPADFARTNQILSSAITATKQQTPQVILLPAPVLPPPLPKGSKTHG